MYSVKFTQTAAREFEQITKGQPQMARRIAFVVDKLACDPMLGIPLKGELQGLRKYRVGSYRIIYQIFHKQLLIIVLDVGHRKEVYR